jgi:hypothetical protein
MSVFDRIQVRRPKYSTFDLSHEKKLSCNLGQLVPVYLEEILPGDRFKVNSEIMLRFAPLLAPLMHRVNVYVHFFFVPNRLVWSEWERFITAGAAGVPNPPITFPVLSQRPSKGTLSDYLGLPIDKSGTGEQVEVSALPFRGYHLIYNEYYRDPNVSNLIDIENPATGNALHRRAWEKDYNTACLPWAQRGPDVQLPVDNTYQPQYLSESTVFDQNGPAGSGDVQSDANSKLRVGASQVLGRIQNLEEQQNITTKITINDLRSATRLQEFLEKTARGGYRYIEQLFAHFGVKSSDARLDRPEYLGGGRTPVTISEVLNTTDVENRAPQGSMAGHGISVGTTNQFRRSFEEHGYVFGIMSILPRTAYQQGVHRLWKKFSREDYAWPSFAHLGEQAVTNEEVYHDFTSGSKSWNEDTFGYQQRYAEYKYGCSTVAGDFRDNLAFWHLGRIFNNRPVLNDEFIAAKPDAARIFAVDPNTTNVCWVQIFHHVKARRPLPYYGTPTL